MTTQRGESHNWGRAAGGRGFCAWARFEWSGLLVSPPARARSSVDGWMEVIMRLSTAHNQRTDRRPDGRRRTSCEEIGAGRSRSGPGTARSPSGARKSIEFMTNARHARVEGGESRGSGEFHCHRFKQGTRSIGLVVRQTLPLRSPFGFTVPVQSTCSSRKIRTMSRSNAYLQGQWHYAPNQVSAHSLVLPNDIGVTIDPRALPPRLNVKEIHPSGRSLARMHHLLIFYPHSLSPPLD